MRARVLLLAGTPLALGQSTTSLADSTASADASSSWPTSAPSTTTPFPGGSNNPSGYSGAFSSEPAVATESAGSFGVSSFDGGGVNASFLDQLASHLELSGLTTLAGLARGNASAVPGVSTTGDMKPVQEVFSVLGETGGNITGWVLFAPSNEAFTVASKDLFADANLLARVLSYHIVEGNFTAGNDTSPQLFAFPHPYHTVARTIFSAPCMKNSTLAGGSDSSSTADNSSSSDASNSTSSGATGNITWPCVKLEARRAQAIAWTNVTLPVAHKADDDDDEATQKRDVAGLRRDAADGNTAGSRRDALAIEKRSDEPGSTRDTAQILNQGATNVTVLNTTRFGPYILVSTVDAVLRAPGPLAEVLVRPEMNLTSLAAFLRYWNVTGDMEGAWVDGEHSGDASSRDGSDASNSSDASSQDGSDASSRNASDVPSLMGLFNHSSGYTLFAPSNDALIAAGEQMAAFAKNGTAFDVLLENHIINGTTMYSSELFPPPTSDGVAIQGKLAQNYTSGAGQTLSFTANETGRYIWSGDPPSSSARILHTDVLVDNGVAHIIGNVLFNFEDDWGKAKVAYNMAVQSASSASPTETGPLAMSTSLTSTSTPTSYYFDDDGSGNGVWPQLGSANGYLAYLIALVWVGIGAAVVV